MHFNNNTRLFTADGNSGNNNSRSGIWSKFDKASLVLGTLGAGAALVTAGHSMYKASQDDKFTVVFRSATGQVKSQSFRSYSGMEAIKKAKRSPAAMGGSDFRAFKYPEQDTAAQEYAAHLSGGRH